MITKPSPRKLPFWLIGAFADRLLPQAVSIRRGDGHVPLGHKTLANYRYARTLGNGRSH